MSNTVKSFLFFIGMFLAFLLIFLPWLTMFADVVWWFFTGHKLTSVMWNEGRVIVGFFYPVVVMFLIGIAY